MDMNSFWFEYGFSESLKAFIQHNQFVDATNSCLNESHRWAKLLLESGFDIEVELHEGFFQIDGDPCQSEGHTWLTVNGCIFDPTAAQFDGDIDSSFYQVHESCENDDLLERLRQYGCAVDQQHTSVRKRDDSPLFSM